MNEYCYDGACGGIITERWRGDMQDLSCNRGYGMMCEGGTYAEEMRKFASLCGLTIDARLKAAAVKSDKTREAITNKFGNI